jgi:hypothetical protein
MISRARADRKVRRVLFFSSPHAHPALQAWRLVVVAN